MKLSPKSSTAVWYKHPSPWVMTVVVALVAFIIGWFIPPPVTPPQALRMGAGGYNFIDPLLACNINNSNVYKENTLLSNEMQSIINSHKANGDISKASVYFTNLKTGNWANVNGTEMFYPSSLGKIPLMMAYLQIAGSAADTSNLLSQKVLYPVGSIDLNTMQDITPPEAIVPGQYYTVEQLIGYMIKYSDNNATALLDANINHDTLNRVYGDLGIPSEGDVNIANADFMTAHQVSTMFRVLYNGTYLSRDDSEKALALLSQTSFTQGLVAGVATSTVVSHKLGLVGIAPNNITTEHELHDCGIVYGKNPYLMCVMTRGTAPLPILEGIIAQLSKAAFEDVQNGQ